MTATAGPGARVKEAAAYCLELSDLAPLGWPSPAARTALKHPRAFTQNAEAAAQQPGSVARRVTSPRPMINIDESAA